MDMLVVEFVVVIRKDLLLTKSISMMFEREWGCEFGTRVKGENKICQTTARNNQAMPNRKQLDV